MIDRQNELVPAASSIRGGARASASKSASSVHIEGKPPSSNGNPAQASIHLPVACPTEALLRQCAELAREIERGQGQYLETGRLGALVEAAAFTEPTSRSGMAFLAIIARHYANVTSDFVDEPWVDGPNATHNHITDRLHIRKTAGDSLIRAIWGNDHDDPDLDAMCDYLGVLTAEAA